MKRLPWILLAGCAFLCGFSGAEFIRWTWHDCNILSVIDAATGSRLEIGLRNDGIVVWREVVNTTNSPSEAHIFYGREWWTTNELILTNRPILMTNIVR